MKLGFIGTGNIVSDVVTGICKSKISYKKIIISPRNKQKAKKLKQKFQKILIAKNNQDVIDNSDWVFLGVLPKVGEKILPKLIFKEKQTIIFQNLSIWKILPDDLSRFQIFEVSIWTFCAQYSTKTPKLKF